MPHARTTLLAALAALAATGAADARAAVTIDGGGFGHGIGLSQYGAYGYALREGRDAGWITGHYFPNTTLGQIPNPRVRVLLKEGPRQTVCGARHARQGERGRTLRLDPARSYRFTRAPGGRLAISEAGSGRRRGSLKAPVRVSGENGVCLRGTADNDVKDGRYRGVMRITRAEGQVRAINDVNMRQYLYGVVPVEMPTTWAIEAIRSQAIVARSYAMAKLDTNPGSTWDVRPDTRSQVYGGRGAETPVGNAAVQATDGRVVMFGGRVAEALFYSTSGGVTANNEEVFLSGTPLPYLRSVPDAHDDISPYHKWTETLSQESAERRLGGAVQGSLRALRVSRRGPSGRVLAVDVVGTGGTRTITGPDLRTRLGLRSTLFSIRAR